MTRDDVTREAVDESGQVFKREWVEATQDLSNVKPDSIVMISDTECITGAEWLRRRDEEFFFTRMQAHQWWAITIATFGLIGIYNGYPQFEEYRRDMMARHGVAS